MQYRINLKAGEELRQELTGKTFLLVDIGVASSIDLQIEIQGFSTEHMRDVKRGFKLRSPGFTSCLLKSAVDCTVEVITSFADINVNYQEGNTVKAIIQGTPDFNIANQPLAFTDVPAVTMADLAPVAVTAAGAALIAPNAARRCMRIANLGPDPVALGFTGITWANRCIVLVPGDVWIEDRAANLAWSAICDAAKTASVTIQEILS